MTVPYDQFVTDSTEWDMKTIGNQLEVKYQTVKTWRRDCLEALRDQVDLATASEHLTAVGAHTEPKEVLRAGLNQLKSDVDDMRTFHDVPLAAVLNQYDLEITNSVGKLVSLRVLVEELGKLRGRGNHIDPKVVGRLLPHNLQAAALLAILVDRGATVFPVEAQAWLEARGLEPGKTFGSMTAADADKIEDLVPHPSNLLLPEKIQFGKPIWTAGKIRDWAMQTRRMNKHGVPTRSKPPGRRKRAVSVQGAQSQAA